MTNLLQRIGRFSSGWRLLQTAIGTIISAIGVIVFLIPSQIAPGGVSGIAIILHEVIGTPVGIMTLIFNIPVQIFAYRTLGGSWLIISTIFSVVIFSAAVDILPAFVSTSGVSENDLLNAIFWWDYRRDWQRPHLWFWCDGGWHSNPFADFAA